MYIFVTYYTPLYNTNPKIELYYMNAQALMLLICCCTDFKNI